MSGWVAACVRSWVRACVSDSVRASFCLSTKDNFLFPVLLAKLLFTKQE